MLHDYYLKTRLREMLSPLVSLHLFHSACTSAKRYRCLTMCTDIVHAIENLQHKMSTNQITNQKKNAPSLYFFFLLRIFVRISRYSCVVWIFVVRQRENDRADEKRREQRSVHTDTYRTKSKA